MNTYRFQFGHCSLELGSKTGFSYLEQQEIDPWSKPVHAIRTHGMQVIGVPEEVVHALGRHWLQKAKPASVLLGAHFETEQAIYQLHVNTRVQLALRDLQSRQDVHPPPWWPR
jgi:hypothetical protein